MFTLYFVLEYEVVLVLGYQDGMCSAMRSMFLPGVNARYQTRSTFLGMRDSLRPWFACTPLEGRDLRCILREPIHTVAALFVTAWSMIAPSALHVERPTEAMAELTRVAVFKLSCT